MTSIALSLLVTGLAQGGAQAPCTPGWTEPRDLLAAPGQPIVVSQADIVRLPQGVAFIGYPSFWKLADDTIRIPELGYAGVLFRDDGSIARIPQPPGTRPHPDGLSTPLIGLRAVATGRGPAHVLWGTAADTARLARHDPDTIWYARYDGAQWTRREFVLARTDSTQRGALHWDGVPPALALVGDTVLHLAIPTQDSFYVLRRTAGGWSRHAFPFGAFNAAAAADGRGGVLVAFAPAYFHPPRAWDMSGLYVIRSWDGGARWSDPVRVHHSPGLQPPQGLHLLDDGRVLRLLWLSGVEQMIPDSLYLMSSADRGATWQRHPTAYVPDGMHGAHASLGARGTIQVAGSLVFGGGGLRMATWHGGRWRVLTDALPFDPAATTTLKDVFRPSLSAIPPDSLYLTWTIFRPVRAALPWREFPGVPITMLAKYRACPEATPD